MKYLLIPKCYGPKYGGGYIAAKTLVSKFPEYLDLREEPLWKDRIQYLYKKYKKLIFTTQAPHSYPVNITNVRNINHLIVIRDEDNHPLYNSASNGFHYYKNHESIKHYLPLIPDMSHIRENPPFPCLGFYARPFRIPDSFKKFTEILLNLPYAVNVCTMGQPLMYLHNFKNVRRYSHHYNRDEFFKNITHYVYPLSAVYIDPFPTSLCEAVQCGKQIIIPKIRGRNHKDGIDDIKDCIEYHKEFIEGRYSYTNLLNFERFKGFYLKLFNNDFEYQFDRNKYKTFKQWLLDLT